MKIASAVCRLPFLYGILACLQLVTPLKSQSVLFSWSTESEAALTTPEASRYLALSGNEAYSFVGIIAASDLKATNTADTLQILLSNDTLVAEALQIRDDSSGYLWSGRLVGEPGYVSVWQHDGITAGYVQAGSRFFEILPIKPSYQFWVERAPGGHLPCGDDPGSSPGDPPPGPDTCSYSPEFDSYNTCPALISVLVVVTQEAKDYVLSEYGDLNAFIQLGQASVNQAFYNSDIPNKEVRVNWVEVDENFIHVFDNPPFIFDDILKVPNLLSPLRGAYDFAVLLTDRNYPSASGIVYSIGPDSANAYAIVEAKHFIGQYTFAHEIGHLLGCRHNWPWNLGNDNTNTCAHAFRDLNFPSNIAYNDPNVSYAVEGSWHTIVGVPILLGGIIEHEDENGYFYYYFTDDSRILHFSNPDVLYDGRPTGSIYANNAAFVRNNACVAADFFPTQELGLFIEQPPYLGCANDNWRTFSATVLTPEAGIPGQGPYEYTWYGSTNSVFNNPDSLGTGQTITLQQLPNNCYFWIKCVLRSIPDGVVVSRVRRVDHRVCCPDPEPGGGGGGGEQRLGASFIMDTDTGIFPNPTASGLPVTLRLHDLAGETAEVQITTASAALARQVKLVFNLQGQTEFLLPDLPAGFYLLRVLPKNAPSRVFKLSITQ